MTAFLNYDRAVRLLDVSDAAVVRTVARLQNVMLATEEMPVAQFDVLQFFHSVTSSILKRLGHSLLLPEGSAVLVVNTPDIRTSGWADTPFATQGFAGAYIGEMDARSRMGAPPFDLGFACHVASAAFEGESLEWVRQGIGRIVTPESFDSWLSGFGTGEGT